MASVATARWAASASGAADRCWYVWSVLGGWLGAWCAQRLLAHKSRKPSFRRCCCLTVAIHAAVLGTWLVWPGWRSTGLF